MIFKLTLYATKYDLKSNTDITFLSYPCLKLTTLCVSEF